MRALNQISAFKYVTEPNAPTYRAIIHAFHEARAHYVIELRPADVRERISKAGLFAEIETDEQLDYHLSQLVEWGNLAASHDSSAVTRLEDFYRKRLLYHLTAVGEAAHRSVLEVEATVGRSGSLQTTMLQKIRDAVRALAAMGPLAPAESLVRSLHDLFSAFDTLTEEANRFIGELDRSGASERIDEERFILYKEALVAYISRFVEQLRRLAEEIRVGIDDVERAPIDELVVAASRSADIPPALGTEDPVAAWTSEQLARWAGVKTWFIGNPAQNVAATVDRLADVAVDAVVGLTRTLTRLNDRRSRPVDRAADFRALARWFHACRDDGAAHQLFHAAFCLASARHFHMAEADPELVGPSTSWWDAPPVDVPVRLRSKGSLGHAGRPAAAPDHSATRQWIAQKRRRERAQVDAAIRHFSGRGAISLRDIAELDAAQFDLLLALLDQALSAPADPSGVKAVRTADGRLNVRLHSPPDDEMVSIATPTGTLRCRNFRIEVEPAIAAVRHGLEGSA